MKCKTSYVKAERRRYIKREWVDAGHVFELSHLRYFRRIKTCQEIRRNYADNKDAFNYRLYIKLRPSRCGNALCSWNLERSASMSFKRSWKRFYKCRYQWGVNL